MSVSKQESRSTVFSGVGQSNSSTCSLLVCHWTAARPPNGRGFSSCTLSFLFCLNNNAHILASHYLC